MSEQLYPVGALRTRMEIRTYPRDDETFRATVLVAIRRFDRIRDMSAIPGRLERHIAAEFPFARARYQDALASTTGTPVMYAFRDGALVAAMEGQSDGGMRSESGSSPAAAGSGG